MKSSPEPSNALSVEQHLIVDLGKVEAILPDRFYPKTEKYNVGERVQALLL